MESGGRSSSSGLGNSGSERGSGVLYNLPDRVIETEFKGGVGSNLPGRDFSLGEVIDSGFVQSTSADG